MLAFKSFNSIKIHQGWQPYALSHPLPGRQYRDFEPFVEEIQRKVGSDIVFRLELVDSLKSNPRKKRSFIEQKLNLSRCQIRI